ncbi:MAG: S8 family serine peptidase, partial [Sedimentisphaerales bacterium]|nr:S8 family serine peptidase [Sedimentisphaerales bacterium]
GIDSDHPDLSDNIADGWHYFLDGASGAGAEDDHGHGTNVAGIITSRGFVAPLGVAPDADILPIKVLDKDLNFSASSDIVAAIDYVVSHLNDYDNLCVMNMSLGTKTRFSDCPCDSSSLTWLQNLKDSVDAAKDVGIVIFASSGNEGKTTEMPAPACLSAVTAVAAVYDQDLGPEPDSGTYHDVYDKSWPDCNDLDTYPDLITCFSNRNGCNELAAPGRNILSTGMFSPSLTSTFTGTSQASPHCAAVAALMHEKAEFMRVGTWPAWIVQTMKDTGVPTFDPAATSPNPIRVDAFAAVNQFIEPWAGFKWKQFPNTSGYGMDIACDIFDYPGPSVQRRLADDFLCTTTGPITKVVLYASWKADSKATLGRIHLAIYSDIPDPDGDGPAFSTPGYLLWEKDFYSVQEDFTESRYYTIPPMTMPGKAWWWDPAGGNAPVQNDDKETWRYDIPINRTEAFVQQGDPCEPVVYWLGVHVYFGGFIPVPSDPGFGWKTSLISEAWNDAAVYSNDAGSTWSRLKYPMGLPAIGENIDLAFEILGNICCSCPDYNSDETITLEDYAGFADHWGWTGPSGGDDSIRDLNCDGSVDYKDVSILARLWLAGCMDDCRGCF